MQRQFLTSTVIAMAILSGCSKEPPNELLWKAISLHDIQGVKDALARGARVDAEGDGPYWGLQPIHQEASSENDDDGMIKFLLGAGAKADAATQDGRQPLHCAARSGNGKAAQALLSAGAPIDAPDVSNGRTPLMEASGRGRAKIVKILLASGANVNAADKHGLHPIHYASGALMAPVDRIQIINMLLDAGAKVDTPDAAGSQPIHYAAEQSMSVEAVKLLLEKGAKVDASTSEGVQPIHKAAWAGDLEIVKLLIASGAKIHAKTKDGSEPIDWAERGVQDAETIEWLTKNAKQ